MEANDHGEHVADKSNICRLEWIALAIDAARRYKEEDRRPAVPARTLLETDDQ